MTMTSRYQLNLIRGQMSAAREYLAKQHAHPAPEQPVAEIELTEFGLRNVLRDKIRHHANALPAVVEDHDLVGIANELGDIVHECCVMAALYGINFNDVLVEINISRAFGLTPKLHRVLNLPEDKDTRWWPKLLHWVRGLRV